MGTLPIIASRQSSLMHILPVEARAIFLGGKKISASDDILSRLSYLELGLRCTVCGEPIYYRSGDVRASHFAHFPELSYIKQEKCERRRRYTSRPQLSPGWYDIDQKQKFALFQKHFFEIIREKLVELPPYYPDSPSLAGIQNIDPVSMDLLLSIRKEREYCEQYIQKCEKHYVGLLQIDIAREAFDYLMIISSEGMTLVILQNLISQNKKMFDSLNKVDAPKEIMIMLADTLLTIHWPESFTGYHSTSHSRRQSLIKAKDLNELYRVKVDDGLNSFVCFDRGRFSVESTTEDSVSRVVLGHFDTRELRRKEIERRKISRASVPQAFSVQIDLVSGSDEVKNKIEEHIRRSALEIDIKAPQEGVTVDRSIVDSCERNEVVYEEFKSYKKLVCFKKKVTVLHQDLRLSVPIKNLLSSGKGEVILHKTTTRESADHLTDDSLLYPSHLRQSYYHSYEDSQYSQHVVARVSIRTEEGKNYKRKIIAREFFRQSAEYETVIENNPKVKAALSRLVEEVCEKLIKSVDAELRPR